MFLKLSKKEQPMKIAILTNTSDNIKDLTRITIANKMGYANKHNYSLECLNLEWHQLNQILPAYIYALEMLKKNDILMTMGADTMFTNWNIKIEDVLDNNKIMISKEKRNFWPINDDVMIWKNTPEVIEFLERIIHDFHIWVEYAWRAQVHIWNLIQEDPKVSQIIKIVEPEIMNQHPKHWQLGNWIVHFYAMELNEKIEQAIFYNHHWPTGNPVLKEKRSILT